MRVLAREANDEYERYRTLSGNLLHGAYYHHGSQRLRRSPRI